MNQSRIKEEVRRRREEERGRKRGREEGRERGREEERKREREGERKGGREVERKREDPYTLNHDEVAEVECRSLVDVGALEVDDDDATLDAWRDEGQTDQVETDRQPHHLIGDRADRLGVLHCT